MTFEELNEKMKFLLESENFEQAKKLWKQEEDNIATFSDSQKYKLLEKKMILYYKNSFYEESLRINKCLERMASSLGEQYVLTAKLWRINIQLAKKNYSKALYYANLLILDVEQANLNQQLKSETNNTILRIYIESKKYARMEKLFRKMLREDMDEHSKLKMLMNVGAAYYSLGKYSMSMPLFMRILSVTQDAFFLGCANLYVARMVSNEGKKDFYTAAINNFEKIQNERLIGISKQELNELL